MFFEVYPIKGESHGSYDVELDTSHGEHTSVDVAEVIRQKYTSVAEAGGSIVAAHTLKTSGIDSGQIPNETLFLVAKFEE